MNVIVCPQMPIEPLVLTFVSHSLLILQGGYRRLPESQPYVKESVTKGKSERKETADLTDLS